jgi:hypothetical protein
MQDVKKCCEVHRYTYRRKNRANYSIKVFLKARRPELELWHNVHWRTRYVSTPMDIDFGNTLDVRITELIPEFRYLFSCLHVHGKYAI